MESDHVVVERRLLDSMLPERAVVLDAGCGRTTRLASLRSRIDLLVGVDLDERAGRENQSLDLFLPADLSLRLPFADASFDLIYANFVLEHLTAPQQTFAEWRRVLRDRGGVVVCTSNRSCPMIAAATLLPQQGRVWLKRSAAGVAEGDVFPAVYLANTPARLTALMGGAGLAPVNVVCVATLHRYAGRRERVARAMRGAERLLPPQRRATIVAGFRAA